MAVALFDGATQPEEVLDLCEEMEAELEALEEPVAL